MQNGDDFTPYLNVAANGVNSAYEGFMGIQINSTVSTLTQLQVDGINNATNTKDSIDLIYDDTVKNQVNAARDLYLYNTETKTMTHIAKGQDMTDYLNANNEIVEGFLLVDKLRGPRVTGELKLDPDKNGVFDPFPFDATTIEQNRSHAQLMMRMAKRFRQWRSINILM